MHPSSVLPVHGEARHPADQNGRVAITGAVGVHIYVDGQTRGSATEITPYDAHVTSKAS